MKKQIIYRPSFYDRISPFFTLLTSNNELLKINKESILLAKKNKIPVTILLHGISDNPKSLYWVIKYFRKQGIYAVSLGYDFRVDLIELSENFKKQVSKIIKASNNNKVNIVGVCLGGNIARYYAEKMHGKKNINMLISVFSPYKPVKKNLTYILLEFIGGNPELMNKRMSEIQNKFTLKNYIALYPPTDIVVGKQYPIPNNGNKSVIQIKVNKSHIFLSYKFSIFELISRLLKNKKSPLKIKNFI
jgi:uncharacterized alpha/beta hydrolase family protein